MTVSQPNSEVLGISLGANATLDITNSAIFRAQEGTATGTNLGFIDVEAGSTFTYGGVLNNQNTIQLIGTGAATAGAFLPRSKVAAISFFRIPSTTAFVGSIR